MDILVKATKLNAHQIDEVINQVVDAAGSAAPKKSKGEVRLDLDAVEFIDPYGFVALWALARFLKKKFKKVCIALPKNPNIQAYAFRMNLSGALRGIARIECDGKYRKSSKSTDVLITLTPIRTKKDLRLILDKLLGDLTGILKTQLDYDDTDISNLSTVISESCLNIFDHSKDKGVIAAQTYSPKNGDKYVVLALADLGIGIRKSLSDRYTDANTWTDGVAILNALKKDFSRQPNRGLGLFIIASITEDYQGSFNIRSGASRIYFRNRAYDNPSSSFPGTQLSISLSRKRT